MQSTPASPLPAILPPLPGGLAAEPETSRTTDPFAPLAAEIGYLRPEDAARVRQAYNFSDAAHRGQCRVSGEPYVSHPVAVARALASWHLDAQALCAALLHDVMEDTGISKAEIASRFGKSVADLVDGVSKLDRIESQSYVEAQAENFRKMLLAMARDLRVILIKLADRLHNMQTLDAFRPEKRRRIARETLDIYAPIANRLGLNSLYRKLQELAFIHAYPIRHAVLLKAVRAARGNRREVVGYILDAIKARLADAGIEAEVQGREKSVFSIYKKMVEKSLSFSQVLDIYGFRIIVRDVPSCYLALGALHALYKPVPGKFKDYIAIPKANGYQSLHTTLIGPYGTPIETQIRTREMHHVAEAGVASHWLYKESDATLTDLQQKTHLWLQSLLEIQSASGDSAEFLEHVKIDLFPDEVYLFTPRGQIMTLPKGSTAVDFAYAVHSDVGNRCVACRINHESLPVRTVGRHGDQVEIITAPHPNPNPAWLGYVKTARARSQIRHFLKSRQYEESAALGERLLGQAMAAIGRRIEEADAASWERMLRDSGDKSKQEVMADIGLGKRLAAVVARRLLAYEEGQQQAEGAKAPASVVIRGSEGMAVQFSRCCRPLPGDPIVGSIKKGQGLIVHTADCASIRRSRASEPEKWIDVEWEPERGRLFESRIRVEVENRRGVLAKVAADIAESGSNIENVSMDEERGAHAALNFSIMVGSRVHLARVMRSLRHIPEVLRIVRVRE